MNADRPPWHETVGGVVLVTLVGVVGVAGLLLVTDLVGPTSGTRTLVERNASAPLVMPLRLYLFTLIGAVAYVFATLSAVPDADVGLLVRLGLRVPAALLVVTGIYLVAASIPTVPSPADPGLQREFAGTAFLVGLFVDHALRSLRGVSSRLYPADPRDLFVEKTDAGDRRP